MNHSIFKFNWWNGHNVTILLIVIIEFRFDPDHDPDNPSDCNEEEFDPRDPHQVVVVLKWIALARIFNFWLHESDD